MKDDTTSEFGIKDFAVKTVSWTKEREEKLTEEQKKIAKRPRLSVVGTWGGYLSPQNQVTHDAQDQEPMGYQHFAFFVQIGLEGEESFQMLQDLSWERIVH